MNEIAQAIAPIQRKLDTLRETVQSAELRLFSLQAGHERSQALAELWNATAAVDSFLALEKTCERFAIGKLMSPAPEPPAKKRPIGFTADLEGHS